jgi:hypothetical protein
METLLAILGGAYLFISWSFGMVKTLNRPYLLGFVLFEVALGFAHVEVVGD